MKNLKAAVTKFCKFVFADVTNTPSYTLAQFYAQQGGGNVRKPTYYGGAVGWM